MLRSLADSEGNIISVETSTEQQNSIELSKNAKGDCAWKVKVYSDDKDKIGEVLRAYAEKAECQAMDMKNDD